MDFAGNNIKPILTSKEGANRPESDYAKSQKVRDHSTRWRQTNVIQLSLEKVGRVSQQYDGHHSKSNVTKYMEMDIDDECDRVTIHNYDVPGNPYSMLSVSLYHYFDRIYRILYTRNNLHLRIIEL